MSLSSDYWEDCWQREDTRWDIGYASPPLVKYTDQLQDKNIRILIPGAGRAHEAIHLHRSGFTQVYVCDWAATAFDHLKTAAADFPEEHLIVGDFFNLDLRFDLLLEQTFFCAITPDLRPKYVEQVAKLLQPTGKIAGLMFDTDFPKRNPPYGGSKAEYEALFSPQFHILQMDTSPDSIPSRLGNELFVEMQVKA